MQGMGSDFFRPTGREKLLTMREHADIHASQVRIHCITVSFNHCKCVVYNVCNVCNARNISKCVCAASENKAAQRIVLDGPAMSCTHLYFKASG